MTRKRGRPKGHKLSEETKLKIAKSMTGQRHSQSTKEAIRTSLLNYFEQRKRKERSMTTIKDKLLAIEQSMTLNTRSRISDLKHLIWQYENLDTNDPTKIKMARTKVCEGIAGFYDVGLGYLLRETQLELLACILRTQSDIDRCRSHEFMVYKSKFRKMQLTLEIAVARPLMLNSLMGVGDCCGFLNGYVTLGSLAAYSAMAATHTEAGDSGKYALRALNESERAYSGIEEDFEDLVPGKLSTDQKILLSVILGHMATVNRVVQLFRNSMIKYAGEDKVKEEIDEPIANLNKRFLFINSILNPVSDDDVEKHLAKSKDYSRKMKVVVSRKGDGSKPEHYTIHSPLLPLEVDDMAAIKEYFPDHEEFLNDEDGRYMENNFCDVTVRKVQLGKISSKMEWVEEPVLRAVPKE